MHVINKHSKLRVSGESVSGIAVILSRKKTSEKSKLKKNNNNNILTDWLVFVVIVVKGKREKLFI